MSQNCSEESRKLIMLIVNHISNTTSLHARALNLYSTHFCQDPSVDKGPNIRKDVGRKLRERETGRVERTAGMYYITSYTLRYPLRINSQMYWTYFHPHPPPTTCLSPGFTTPAALPVTKVTT